MNVGVPCLGDFLGPKDTGGLAVTTVSSWEVPGCRTGYGGCCICYIRAQPQKHKKKIIREET